MRPFPPSRAVLAALALTGCARGCEQTPPPPPPAPPRAAAPVARHPAAAVEERFGLRLPERVGGTILPALSTLPWRRLPSFEADKHLIVRLDRVGLTAFERTVPHADLRDDAAITELLRWAVGQWTTRAGVAANRLVLAADAGTSAETTARVRRVAMTAAQWRVVALARDGEALVELLLDPPAGRRPANEGAAPRGERAR